eukprot:TRINITY_DN9840_c0_g1_i1.p1 TRINITY_DN9840_c0_g1~~TRINITY_DN9840_c0_g1_i1.p1  ORF type:complete len:591 (-),score=112.42 TRINITY_DN9840_c0_g1_i1:23-1795(-)
MTTRVYPAAAGTQVVGAQAPVFHAQPQAAPPPQMVHKQAILILVLDTTALMKPYYKPLREEYLEPLIGLFYRKSIQQGIIPSISLVMFRDYAPFADYTVRSCPFSKDLNEVRFWLDQIEFQAGGFCETVIAEALFQSWKLIQHRCKDVEAVERHVLLVCNSSPHETPCRTSENQALNGFELAEKLAKENVNLSVICPRFIPKIKDIFTKGMIPGANETRDEVSKMMVLLRGLSLPMKKQTVPVVAEQAQTFPQMATNATVVATTPQAQQQLLHQQRLQIQQQQQQKLLQQQQQQQAQRLQQQLLQQQQQQQPQSQPQPPQPPQPQPQPNPATIKPLNAPEHAISLTSAGVHPIQITQRPIAPQPMTNVTGPTAIVSPAQPITTTPTPAPTPRRGVPIWEGTLAWQQAENKTISCNVAAVPRVDTPGDYATPWPASLMIKGVCPANDPVLNQQFQNALAVEFQNKPIRNAAGVKAESYNDICNQLHTSQRAAVVELMTKTLVIVVISQNTATTTERRLVGLLLPRMQLKKNTPGASAAKAPQPAQLPGQQPSVAPAVGQSLPPGAHPGYNYPPQSNMPVYGQPPTQQPRLK